MSRTNAGAAHFEAGELYLNGVVYISGLNSPHAGGDAPREGAGQDSWVGVSK